MPRKRGATLATVALIAAVVVGVAGESRPPAQGAAGRGGDAAGRMAAAFGRLPLHFEANQGQAGPGVGFVVRGGGMSMAVSAIEAHLELAGPDGPSRLGMQLVGADPAAHQVGQEPLKTTVNHYAGPDPARWLTGIPTYGRVRTVGAYPGIDLVWHGRPGALEYDFVVDPGADPARIRLGFDGATGLRLDGGDLVVGVAGGEVRQRAPVAYQTAGGRRRGVESRFVVEGDQVGFAVGPYDRRRPLVIDPVLAYATFLGGPGRDVAADVGVDGAGNAYLAGRVESDPWVLVDGGPSPRVGAAMAYHPGTGNLVLFGGRGPGGTVLADTWVFDGTSWAELAVPGPTARTFAGLAYEPTTARLVLFGGETGAGALGDTWIFDGSAWSSPPTIGATPPARSRTALATYRLTATQGVVLFGGRGAGGDLLGDTWAWNGLAWAVQTPPTAPASRAEAAVATDADGWAHVFGGQGQSGVLGDLWAWSGGTWERRAEAASIAPAARRGASLVGDDGGNLRLVGGKASGTMRADRWIYRAGEPEPWVKEKKSALVPGLGPRVGSAAARHEGAGAGVVMGGKGPDGLVAETWALELFFSPPGSGFVAKLNAAGTALEYLTYLGVEIAAGHTGTAMRIAVDPEGAAYVAATTDSTEVPTTSGAYQPACSLGSDGGCADAFVLDLHPSGELRYGTYIGGARSDYVEALSLGPAGTVYVAGLAHSIDFPTTPGAYQPTCAYSVDGQCSDTFLAKLAPTGAGPSDLVYSTYFGASSNVVLTHAVAVDGEGVAHLTGSTESPDLATTPGAYQPACAINETAGCRDSFVAKLAPLGAGADDLRYSTYLGGGCCTVRGAPLQGGQGYDFGAGIAVGPDGTVYVAGGTGSQDFPITEGAFDETFECFSDFGCIGFVAALRLDGAGVADLRYATYLGGGAAEQFKDVALDGASRVVVVGQTKSSNFPLRKAVQKTCGCAVGAAGEDAVVTKLDTTVLGDGSGKASATNAALVFSTFLGGTGGDVATGVALDSSDNIYVAGDTSSSDFPITSGAFQSRFAGIRDGFVAKITGVP